MTEAQNEILVDIRVKLEMQPTLNEGVARMLATLRAAELPPLLIDCLENHIWALLTGAWAVGERAGVEWMDEQVKGILRGLRWQ